MNSWKQTSRNTTIKDGILETELRTIKGKWVKNRIKYNGEDYDNINGYLVKVNIPKHIYQTHKSLDFVKNDHLLKRCTDSWKRYKDFKYSFYSDEEQDDFMKQNFPDIYQYYSSLPLIVMKADLWRYCIIYHYGGIYADSDTVCLNRPHFMSKDSVYLVTPREDTHWLCQWVFAAPKGSPILKKVIDNCVEKIKQGIDFTNIHFVHETTGPAMYSRSIGEWLFENGYPTSNDYSSIKTSESLYVYGTDFNKKHVKHMFNGDKNWKKERLEKLTD